MAKKFVRGITDIKTINNQDFDTNNVNDLLSDGKHNYIHRKKQDGSEEYHNLTNNIKTIQSDDTDLLTVTNYNNTTNSATLRPKHDVQKEQVLESTDETILIEHGENGTEETTSVDVNPEIVLEHDNLVSNSDYITIEHEEGSNTSEIKTDELDSKIIEIENKIIGRNLYALSNNSTIYKRDITDFVQNVETGEISFKVTGADPFFGIHTDVDVQCQTYAGIKIPVKVGQDIAVHVSNEELSKIYVSFFASDNIAVKRYEVYNSNKFVISANKLINVSYITLRIGFNDTPDVGSVHSTKVKVEYGSTFTEWSHAPEDVDALLAQKQNTLTSNTSIGVSGTGLRQLYTQSQTYTHTNGILKTHVKSVANSSSVSTGEEEFNFLAKMNEGQHDAVFTLNEHDTAVFQYIVDTYGINNVINVCNTSLTLNGSQLTFGSNGTTYNPHIITFSDIIPASAINTQQNAPSRGDKVDETVEFDKTDEIVDKVDEIVDSKQSE